MLRPGGGVEKGGTAAQAALVAFYQGNWRDEVPEVSGGSLSLIWVLSSR